MSASVDDDKTFGRVPFWCPVCDLVMRDKDNSIYFKWGCCNFCFIEHVEDREERWLGGWRPPTNKAE